MTDDLPPVRVRHGNRNVQNIYQLHEDGTETFAAVAMTPELARWFVQAINAASNFEPDPAPDRQPQSPPQSDQRDLIEEYLRHRRAGGPEPDLSEFPEDARTRIRGSFEVLAALADREPLPPIDEDPVAQRLGLVEVPDQGDDLRQRLTTEMLAAQGRANEATERARVAEAAVARVRVLAQEASQYTGLGGYLHAAQILAALAGEEASDGKA